MMRRLQARVLPKAARFLTHRLRGVSARSSAVHADLDPELRVVLALSALTGHKSGLVDKPIPKARVHMRRGISLMTGTPVPIARVRDLVVDGAEGPLEARHYTSVPSADRRPLLIFVHGGGFCMGDLDTHDQPCRELCAEGGFDVLSIAYRLAPEHPYPAGIEDARAALRWARAHAEELGVDPARIGMGGDSAGGTITAVVSRLERDANNPGPSLQLLLYPVTDSTHPFASRDTYGDGLVLTRSDIDTFTREYNAGGVPPSDPGLSPLRAESLANLPPAIVVTAGCDPLRDEGDAYANAMREAGVDVTHLPAPGMVHGFIHMADVSSAAQHQLRKAARAAAHGFAKNARAQASGAKGIDA